MSDAVRPFHLAIDQRELDDLRARLERVRWPDAETVDDWSQGAPLDQVQKLIAYWRDVYDWRRCEAQLNALGQFETTIDDLDIRFLHVRSRHADAMPMILTHGWPGSVIEFVKCIGALTDPTAHGGAVEDAFHVVIPSLPGYGFSAKPRARGWGVNHIAEAWGALMLRLGYSRYVAQGGDWGAAITTAMGVKKLEGLAAIHLNMPLIVPRDPGANSSAEELAVLARLKEHAHSGSGYSAQQKSKPQTLGYGLADSPVGQAAWIYEKFYEWTDHGRAVENVLSYDELLDNIMLYWLNNAGASAARLYWESFRGSFGSVELEIPTGCSVFPKDIYKAPKSWADRVIHNLIYWNELDRGGHFAAFEQPALFVDELRKCFRTIR